MPPVCFCRQKKEPAQLLPLTRLTCTYMILNVIRRKTTLSSAACMANSLYICIRLTSMQLPLPISCMAFPAYSDCACSYSTTAGFVFVYSFSNNAAGAPHNGHT